MRRGNRQWLAALTLILFGAFAFRLWNLGTQSLWHDEAWTVISSYQPLHPIDPNYPPFFVTLLSVWNLLAGDAVWTLRYFSLLFGVITVAAVALIMRRWFNETSALIAAFLVAISPPLWVYSQEIRSYVLMPLLTVILLALVNALLRPQTVIPRRTWIWLLLTETIALYTHNLAVPLVAWLNVTVIAVLLLRRDWRRSFRWIVAQVGVLIVYLPWLMTQRPTGTPLNTPPQVGGSFLWDIWQSYFTGIKALVSADTPFQVLMAIFGGFVVLLIVLAVWRNRNQRTMLILSQVILLPIFEAIIILAAHIDFHPRYFLLGVIPTLMLVAVGLTSPPAPLSASREGEPVGKFNPSRLALYVIPIMVAVLITGRMASLLYSNAGYQHDDFRAMAAHYASLNAEDAVVIPYGWEPTFDYYQRKTPWKAKVISIPLHTDAATIINRLRDETEGVQRIDFLTWFQLPADVRRAYPCLLGTNWIHQDSPSFSGIKSDSYTGVEGNEELPAPEVFSDAADFGGIQLEGMQSWSGAEGACIITRWKLTQPTTQNWSIAVRALNPFGQEIARSDDALLSNNQVPTSLWRVGEEEFAFSALTLPLGSVPQSNFPVIVSVYSGGTPHALDVIQNGSAAGKNATIGTVTRLARPGYVATPDKNDVQLEDNLYLDQRAVPPGPLQPGEPTYVKLRWLRTQWTDDPAHVTVSLEGQGWKSSSDGTLYPDTLVLTWHELAIPATASGTATLSVTGPSGKALTLAQLKIDNIDHIFAEPPVKMRVDATFTGVGALVGVDAPPNINSGDPFNVVLTWKSSVTPTTAYTVFVHLLDSNGQVVAQSDAQPMNAFRPTTTWLPNEYIVDTHTLTFNRPYSGTATIEVGLYDPVTNKRVMLEDGEDHMVLPGSIQVQRP